MFSYGRLESIFSINVAGLKKSVIRELLKLTQKKLMVTSLVYIFEMMVLAILNKIGIAGLQIVL